MKIGYARVSTEEQNLDLQRHALKAAGCEAVYEDSGVSGAAMERPGLAKALARIKSGDVLVVWKLDRLSRSLRHLIEIIDDLGKAGASSEDGAGLNRGAACMWGGRRSWPPTRSSTRGS